METLTTKRLILRALRPDDLPGFFAYSSHPHVGPNIGWRPLNNMEEARIMLRHLCANDETWAVVQTDTHRFMGTISLHRDKRRNHEYAKEIGFGLHPSFWGAGYAAEAVHAVLRYAFEVKGLLVVGIDHYPHNTRSRRVIEKCGFRYEGIIRRAYELYNGTMEDHVCYSMTQDEYYRT